MVELPLDVLDRIPWEDADLIEISLTSAGINLVIVADVSGAIPRAAGEEFSYFSMSFAGIEKLDMPLGMAHFVPVDYPRNELPDLGGICSLSIASLPDWDERLPARFRLLLKWSYGTIGFEFEAVRTTIIDERIEG